MIGISLANLLSPMFSFYDMGSSNGKKSSSRLGLEKNKNKIGNEKEPERVCEVIQKKKKGIFKIKIRKLAR